MYRQLGGEKYIKVDEKEVPSLQEKILSLDSIRTFKLKIYEPPINTTLPSHHICVTAVHPGYATFRGLVDESGLELEAGLSS